MPHEAEWDRLLAVIKNKANKRIFKIVTKDSCLMGISRRTKKKKVTGMDANKLENREQITNIPASFRSPSIIRPVMTENIKVARRRKAS
ncbi:hypothetical protein [Paenibacillus larvae]|nr:hypothetical protein [Paenibacillus larvae]